MKIISKRIAIYWGRLKDTYIGSNIAEKSSIEREVQMMNLNKENDKNSDHQKISLEIGEQT